MNLIISPIYNAILETAAMVNAIDQFSTMPFVHILVDDNSTIPVSENVRATKNRRVLRINSDVPDWIHKSQLGQAVQLGYDYATQEWMNEIPKQPIDHVFLIESDVVVKADWDKKQIDLIPTLPEDWASLDVQSVDTDGRLTYPTVISPRHGFVRDDLEHQHYADFQCTLFNPLVLPEKSGVKFSDFRSHFDILWSRKIEELTGRKHYRTMLINAFHYGSASRSTLPKEL